MKKTGVISIFVLLLLGTISTAWTPNRAVIKEGAITYKVDIDSEDMNPMVKFMLNDSELIIRFKDQFVRTEFDMSMASTTSIIDGSKQEGIILMSAMGNNMAIKMEEEDIKQQNNQSENAKITYLDETKEIAGYLCKKATIEAKGNNGQTGKLTMFYTEDIRPENMSTQYTVEGLKGFPLQFEMDMQGTKVTMVAQSVSKEKQSKELFSTAIPDGYDEMTMEDLKKMQGGR